MYCKDNTLCVKLYIRRHVQDVCLAEIARFSLLSTYTIRNATVIRINIYTTNLTRVSCLYYSYQYELTAALLKGQGARGGFISKRNKSNILHILNVH